MANGIHPSSDSTNPKPKPILLPTKPPPRHLTSYNPPSKRRRHGFCRVLFGGCCCFFFWLIVSIFLLLLLAAMAFGFFYVLYNPKPPHVYVSSITVSSFNITNSNKLNSSFNFTITAKNKNEKIELFYNQVEAHCYANDVEIGSGSFPAFVLEPNNFATMTTVLRSNFIALEPLVAVDLKNKEKLPVRFQLDTEGGMKIGKVKTQMVGIRMSCGGFNLVLHHKQMNGSVVDVECVIKLRIRIFGRTFG